MSQAEMLERSADRGQQVAIVDCDVHPIPNASDEVDNYMSESWRRFLERHGTPLEAGWGPGFGWTGLFDRPDLGLDLSGNRDTRHDPLSDESQLDLFRRTVMDEYGVDYAVLNGHVPVVLADRRLPELAADRARAANDWMFEQWMEPDPRLFGSINVAWDFPELAIRELEARAVDPRWVQVMMPSEALEPLGSRKYWPIYEAATAHGLPVAAHIGSFDPARATGLPTYMFERHLDYGHSLRRQLLNMVCEGLFEAVPGVRIVLAEGGSTWAGSLRWSLDSAFELLGGEVELAARPSEYLDEFVWYTTQPVDEPDDPTDLERAIDHARLESRLLFSSDYPHWDFDSPRMALPRSMSSDLRRRIMAGNACELYGLPR